ncbi:MAG: C10 family peptidase [Alistipes sp.]|nr:C10 family peptidase [Alistipes sp.]
MKNLYLYLIVIITLTCSCVKQTEPTTSQNTIDVQGQDGVEYLETSLSFENAIGNANFIFSNTEGVANKTRRISKVDLLTSADLTSAVATRSKDSNGVKESPLAYVVNYADNQGYAILAADEQLPPIIAIGDNGTFSTKEFLQYISGEISTRTSEEITPAQEMQYTMVNNALTITGLTPTIPSGSIQQTGVDTTMLVKCHPLIPVKWGQYSPYNMYSPIQNGIVCVAGCVPVAGAQTLASLCYRHNFRPDIEINSEYEVDWYAINRLIYADTVKYNSGQITPGSRAVATLIRAIGKEANATYSTSSTGTPVDSIMYVYNKIGLSNVRRMYNSSSNAIDSLFLMIVDKNYPVDCCATREDNESKYTHYFNIDGWLRLQYTLNVVTGALGSSSLRVDNVQHKLDLVHVNFGWDGEGDGYYLPGAFDVASDKFDEFREENDLDSNMERNYNLNVSYIVYEL